MDTSSSLFAKFAWYLSQQFFESGKTVQEVDFYPLSKDAPKSAIDAYEKYKRALQSQRASGIVPD